MTRSSIWVALAITSATVLGSPLTARAGGTHTDVGEMPSTFGAAVRMIRDEMGAIDRSRRAEDFADLAWRGLRLAAIAGTVPQLARPTATPMDSAATDIGQACDSLTMIGARLVQIASRHDRAGVEESAARIATFFALLDARLPKQYVCPMRCQPATVYDRPGKCPVCGMDLKLITDDRYSVEVQPASGTIRAGREVTLGFHIQDPAGFDVTRLEVVHEKLLHLIIVSRDLSWFAHVHPVRGENGRFSLPFTFPAGGTYTLFHDFTPPQVGMQVVPVEVEVKGPRHAPVALARDDLEPKRIDGYDVRLTHTGLAPGLGCGFAFWLSRDGKPVTDLEPYLGAMGHLMIVSEDHSVFVHSHPIATSTAGPIVEFAATFPKVGLYKAWGQFQIKGRVVTVPFVFPVTSTGEEDLPPTPGATSGRPGR